MGAWMAIPTDPFRIGRGRGRVRVHNTKPSRSGNRLDGNALRSRRLPDCLRLGPARNDRDAASDLACPRLGWHYECAHSLSLHRTFSCRERSARRIHAGVVPEQDAKLGRGHKPLPAQRQLDSKVSVGLICVGEGQAVPPFLVCLRAERHGRKRKAMGKHELAQAQSRRTFLLRTRVVFESRGLYTGEPSRGCTG